MIALINVVVGLVCLFAGIQQDGEGDVAATILFILAGFANIFAAVAQSPGPRRL